MKQSNQIYLRAICSDNWAPIVIIVIYKPLLMKEVIVWPGLFTQNKTALCWLRRSVAV